LFIVSLLKPGRGRRATGRGERVQKKTVREKGEMEKKMEEMGELLRLIYQTYYIFPRCP
jgi:hypothetical protein